MHGAGNVAGSGTTGVTVIGCGTVGSGVCDILLRQAAMLAERSGCSIVLRHIVVRDVARAKAATDPSLHGLLTTDATAAITAADVSVVVELVGGTTVAADLISAALNAGKAVVTANKALLAARGPELFALAHAKGSSIAFEASVAGGIPVINAMIHGLVANRIDSLVGIVNGTCNFILTKMTREGLDYAVALKQAQQAGFAEADPTLDVSGRDAAQKLAVLAGVGYGVRATEADIHIAGINTLDAADIAFAGRLGYVIKLLAVARRYRYDGQDHLALSVRPHFVAVSDVLADVSGSFNAVSLYGSAVGHTLFYGRGAGSGPTASAVVADIVQTALGLTRQAFARMSAFAASKPAVRLLPAERYPSRFYLRLTARDQAGVLAQVTRVLADVGISIASFLQVEADETNQASVPLVIITHETTQGAVTRAAAQIDQLAPITGKTVSYPILDCFAEFAPTRVLG
jgi:homoserine dehydrogenase